MAVIKYKGTDGTTKELGLIVPMDAALSDTSENGLQNKVIKQTVGDLSSLETTAKNNLVAAINETFTSVSSGKATVASAITDKGVPTASDATFSTMATNIRAIPQGSEPTGNIEITADTVDKTGVNVAAYATATVHPTPSETKSVTTNGDVTPTSGKLLSKVTVNVPTGTARTSADLTISGATVTAPAGLYAEAASKSVATGAYSASATQKTAGSAIMTPTGFTAADSGSYYVTQSTTAGAATGKATIGTAGYLATGNKSADCSIAVSGNGTKLYIPEANPTATASVTTAPSVAVSGAATGFTPASSATSYYVTVNGAGTNGTAKALAGVTDTGIVGSSETTEDTVSIVPSVTGSGNKVYIPAGSATTPATTKQQSKPSFSLSGTTLTANVAATSVDVTPTVTAGYVASGTKGTVTMSSNSNTYTIPVQSKTLTLGAAAPSTVSPDSGKVGLSSVPVSIDTTVIKAENIAKDVTILGVTGTHAGGIGGNYTVYSELNADDTQNMYITEIQAGEVEALQVTANGTYTKATGAYNPVVVNVQPKTEETFDVTPTTSQQTITPTSGNVFKSGIVRAMPTGTLGTVSATKSISGNTATITPKIAAGTAGYNAMAAKSGTAVTVTAAEVCNSGTLTVTTTGSKTCTGYSTVNVNIASYTDLS